MTLLLAILVASSSLDDVRVLERIGRAENAGRPFWRWDADTVSKAGACGWAQVKPSTASGVLGRPVTCRDLQDPFVSARVALAYHRVLLRACGRDWHRAYQRGPGHKTVTCRGFR